MNVDLCGKVVGQNATLMIWLSFTLYKHNITNMQEDVRQKWLQLIIVFCLIHKSYDLAAKVNLTMSANI